MTLSVIADRLGSWQFLNEPRFDRARAEAAAILCALAEIQPQAREVLDRSGQDGLFYHPEMAVLLERVAELGGEDE